MFNIDKYINSPIDIENELLSLLKKEDFKIIFDIGACEAEDSIRFSKLFPNAIIYAFEPRPDNIIKANGLIRKYNAKRIVLENIALSDKNGFSDFFLSEGRPEEAEKYEGWDFGNKSSSLLPPSEEILRHFKWLKFNKKIQVQTMMLEDYTKENKIDAIDYAHIDVQGAELMVLKGAGDFIHNIKIIWMEVENVELYKSQPLKKDVEKFMISNGFVNMLDTVEEVAGDHLYVNSKLFSKNKMQSIISLKSKKQFMNKLKSIKKWVKNT